MDGSGAEARASCNRTGRCRQRFPPRRAPRADREEGSRRAGRLLALLARVLQVFEIDQKNNVLVECRTIRRRVVHGCPPLSEPRRPMDSALYRAVTYSFTRLPCADRDDVLTVTRLINGGTNGLAERTEYLAKAKVIWLEGGQP